MILDAILLIVRALASTVLSDLLRCAHGLGMRALGEVRAADPGEKLRSLVGAGMRPVLRDRPSRRGFSLPLGAA